MDLYLARHGLNDLNGEPHLDRERSLSPKGIKDAAAVAARLKVDGEVPKAILTSVFKRTIQTADILGKALGSRVIPCDEIGPEVPIYPFFCKLFERQNSGLMFMGHHTNLAQFLNECGDAMAPDDLSMGEVRRYSCDPQGKLKLMYRVTPGMVEMVDMKTLESILRV